MIGQLANLNWISIAIAFVAYFILGALWFTLLFKKQYLISLGKENEPEQKPAPIFIIGPAICSLFITITTAILMYVLKIDSYQSTIELALVVGIGYLVANTVNIAINPNIPKPIFYGLISGSYHLLGIFIVCLVLFAMK
ncbi:DUF1761 domain-containing protein [Flavobacterium cupreum]|uniref:DUF1761 domain-containing protein n=2 Tax=Flavobacterium TaxID=237 RepID=A0A4Y7UF01_9FLAO|nr:MULTISPECIES: DUF1761 domain-containing protein [Flavobacterium]RUT67908.1 DUF1761 domain-containing protein [Flavobacterium cupreum]TCN59493.1 uncharacterized protein DUF1761 [Flavobacterium circumlabens]TEB44791.1 DUF1761 domain-containing protein [Flavobacterium circumlabens]